MKYRYSYIGYTVSILLALMLSSCHSPKPEMILSGVNVLPVESSLTNGLSTYYRYAFYRHLNQMATDSVMMTKGERGTPVLQLDHKFAKDVTIYDSKRATGVGVFMDGYLKLDKTGKYRFKALSNDGVQVAVNNEIVVFDPTVHSSRMSETGDVSITAPGWYPIAVKYFQRKGTASLTLYWQPPEAADFEVVPAKVFGHQ